MNKNYPTPHINASPDDFAKTVLLPGDPLRAKFIAENFLDSPRLVNNVRGAQGYTGSYLGTPVSVMASGMGMPSMAIYSYELFKFFEVENIIRVGSIGALAENLQLNDIVLGMGASTTSSFATQYGIRGSFAPIASYELLKIAEEEAKAQNARHFIGNVLTTDVFYNEDKEQNLRWLKLGVLGVEMETAALYMNAARLKKRALAIYTVSDHIIRGEELPPDKRETSFTAMMKIALNTAVRLD